MYTTIIPTTKATPDGETKNAKTLVCRTGYVRQFYMVIPTQTRFELARPKPLDD